MRSFAAFLDRKTVLWGSAPFESDRIRFNFDETLSARTPRRQHTRANCDGNEKQCNVALRRLVLTERTDQGGFGAFGEALEANATLTEFYFDKGRILESDLHKLSQGSRRNNTLEVLRLTPRGLTSQGLQPLIETVRYHNSTLGRLILPRQFVQEQSQFDAALNFHKAFRSACQVVREGGGGGGAAAAAEPDDSDGAVFLQWWPLLGSNHPTVKATVIFCVARVRAEAVAHSMGAPLPIPDDLGQVVTLPDLPNPRQRRQSGGS